MSAAKYSNGIPVTAAHVRALMAYDPETGLMTRRVARGGIPQGVAVGSKSSTGYLFVTVNKRTIPLQRLIWLYVTGAWPVGEVDHINGCKADNRWANLRDVDHSTNMLNVSRANSNSLSKVRGVSPTVNGRFQARLKIDGKSRCLGTFPCIEQAGAAYEAAKSNHLQGGAR